MTNSSGKTREEVFNIDLRNALRQTTPIWDENPNLILAERTGVIAGHVGRRPDLLILDSRLPPVVIESSYDALDADRDAIQKLGLVVKHGQRLIRTAIAIHIPEEFRTRSSVYDDLKSGTKFRFALHQIAKGEFRRWPPQGFIAGDVHRLAALVKSASLPKEEIEKVAEDVASRINHASAMFDSLPRARIEEIEGLISRGSVLENMKTTLVLWLNALLTQQRLYTLGQDVAESLPILNPEEVNPSEIIRAWRSIQQVNWHAVFDPAVKALREVGRADIHRTGLALSHLLAAVERIELAGLGLHINVGAELFPKLSRDRKQAAAFYTQPASAELLSCLAIEQNDLSPLAWRDAHLFEKRCIADLACGTGTLLRAGYRRVQQLHEQAGGTVRSISQLHQTAMERGLIGTDISPIAAHLTSASLAVSGQGRAYGKTRIGWVEVGSDSAGSLEYFAASTLMNLFDHLGGQSSGGEESIHSSIEVRNGSVDWILMNPPYSRSRGGQSTFDVAGLNKKEREACRKRWADLVSNEPVSAKAGMAASFLALARRKVKRGGKIGFVLPLTAAFADSWRETRQMVEEDFENITAVTFAAGKALGKNAISADTGMEEMLLIATRSCKNNAEPSQLIHCVTLNEPATRLGEASEIANAITSAIGRVNEDHTFFPVRVGESHMGQVCALKSTGYGAPWSPLGVTHAGLAIAAECLVRGVISLMDIKLEFSVPMTSIRELFSIGPTHDLIGHPHGGDGRGAFELYKVVERGPWPGPDSAVWSAESKLQRSLVVNPTHEGFMIRKAEAEAMRLKRGDLFYARNMRWTSQSLLCASTLYKHMGGRAWTVLDHDDQRVRKAFALWANSIFGMVVHWTQGQRTHAGRSTTQVNALANMPCPKLDELADEYLDLAQTRFDELARRPLLPSCQAHVDDVRKEIDLAVLEVLGLIARTGNGDEQSNVVLRTTNGLRELWCTEPSVHGQNKKAVKLLRASEANLTST